MKFEQIWRVLVCTGLAVGALACRPEEAEDSPEPDAGMVIIDGGIGGQGGQGGEGGGEGGQGGEGGGEGGAGGGQGGEGGAGGAGGEGGEGGGQGGEGGGQGGEGGGEPPQCDELGMGACNAREDCEWDGDRCRPDFMEEDCAALQPGECVMRDDCAWSRDADACVEAPEGPCEQLDEVQCGLRDDCEAVEVDCADGVDCGNGVACVEAVDERACEDIGDRAACQAEPGCRVFEDDCDCGGADPIPFPCDADDCPEPPPCECGWSCGPEPVVCEEIADLDACAEAGCEVAFPDACGCPEPEPCPPGAECAPPPPCDCAPTCVTPGGGGDDCQGLDPERCDAHPECHVELVVECGCDGEVPPGVEEPCVCWEEQICLPGGGGDGCQGRDMGACMADPACEWVEGGGGGVCGCEIDAEGNEICDCFAPEPAPGDGFCQDRPQPDCWGLDQLACAARPDCDWQAAAGGAEAPDGDGARPIAPPPPCECWVDANGVEICDCDGGGGDVPAGACVPAEPQGCWDLGEAACNNAQGCAWQPGDEEGPCACRVGPNGEEICDCAPVAPGQCVPVRPLGCAELDPDACQADPACELEWLEVPCPPCPPDVDECPACEPQPVCREADRPVACEDYGNDAAACDADPRCAPMAQEVCVDPLPCPPGEDCPAEPGCWEEVWCAPIEDDGACGQLGVDACEAREDCMVEMVLPPCAACPDDIPDFECPPCEPVPVCVDRPDGPDGCEALDEAACGADPACAFVEREVCGQPDIGCLPDDPNCVLPEPVCEVWGECVPAAAAACEGYGADVEACEADLRCQPGRDLICAQPAPCPPGEDCPDVEPVCEEIFWCEPADGGAPPPPPPPAPEPEPMPGG